MNSDRDERHIFMAQDEQGDHYKVLKFTMKKILTPVQIRDTEDTHKPSNATLQGFKIQDKEDSDNRSN